MVTPVTRNKDQAQWIILQGWLKRSRLELALFELSKDVHGSQDLCQYLVENGSLSPEQGRLAREESVRPNPPPPSLESTIQGERELDQRNQAAFLESLAQHYEIRRELSRGAMGVIYEAIQKSTGTTVALKIMLNRSPNDSEIKRFRQEAAVLIQLKHENIIDILDFGIENDQAYFAMKFIEGETLQNAVTETLNETSTAPSWAFTVQVMIDVASALIYCHDSGIIHRDVKPLNIMIDDESQRGILIDFGLLKKPTVIDQTQSKGLTLSGEMVGTPAFMSPEQFAPGSDHGEIGPPSDVWGFGATLFYACTGAPPYNKATLIDIYQAIKHQATPSLREDNPHLPLWLDQLVQDCLENDSAARPDIREVKDRLERGLQDAYASPPIRLLPIALGFALSLVIGALVGFSLLSENVTFVSVQEPKAVTRDDSILLSGQLSKGPVILRVNGRESEIDAKGSFSIKVPLSEGQNTIKAEVVIDSAPVDTYVARVFRDNAAPGIVLFNEFQEREEIYVLDASRILKGRLFDDYPAHVKYQGRLYPCDDMGEFEIPLTAGDEKTVHRLTLYDKAGNFLIKSIKALERDEIERLEQQKQDEERASREEIAALKKSEATLSDPGRSSRRETYKEDLFQRFLRTLEIEVPQQRLLHPLGTLEDWQKAAAGEQDRAIEVIAALLKDAFELIETRSYKVKGGGVRVAAFRHKKTGLRLHLLPGQLRKAVWWPDPTTDAQQDILQTLADPKSDLPYFRSVVSQLSRDIRAKICRDLQIDSDFERFFKSLKSGNFDLEKFTKAQNSDIEKMVAHFKKFPEAFQRLKISCKNQDNWVTDKSYQTLEYVPPFLLGQTEVSQKTWLQFNRDDGPLPKLKWGTSPDFPAYQLSQSKIKHWLRHVGLRLPEKAEWLYGCQGGGSAYYYWRDQGDRALDHCWIKDNSKESVFPVSKSPSGPNGFGLLNMIGNVAEWSEPDWDLWWTRWNYLIKSKGAPETMIPWAAIEFSAPVLGGSIDWPLFRLQRKPCYYASILDDHGVWGFRVAASIRK